MSMSTKPLPQMILLNHPHHDAVLSLTSVAVVQNENENDHRHSHQQHSFSSSPASSPPSVVISIQFDFPANSDVQFYMVGLYCNNSHLGMPFWANSVVILDHH